MTVPQSALGTELPLLVAPVERGRLRFFAEATGQQDPRYTDTEAATAAGYPDLPVPPTFLFGLKLDGPDPFRWLLDYGVDFRFVLHGSQTFSYTALAFAGDVLHLQPRIAALFDKKGGALEFVVLETDVTRDGEAIATLSETIVIRHPELEATR